MWPLPDDSVGKGGEGVGACGRYLAKNAHRNSLITLLAKMGGLSLSRITRSGLGQDARIWPGF